MNLELKDFLEQNTPSHTNYDSDDWRKFATDIVFFRRCSFVQIMKSKLPDFVSFLDKYIGATVSARLHHYVFRKDTVPSCICCGKKLKYIGFNFGYYQRCSRACSLRDRTVIDKRLEASKVTYMEKYGVDHPMKCAEGQKAYKTTMVERYGTENPLGCKDVIDKARRTKIENGIIVSDDERTELELYRLNVRRATKKQPIHLLEHYNERGKTVGSYSLDYMYSVWQGFLDGIPTEIIGDISNLEYVTVSRNSSKGSKCSKEKCELFIPAPK